MQVTAFNVRKIDISKSPAYDAKLTIEDDAGNLITCYFHHKSTLEDFLQEIHNFSVLNQSPF